MNSYSVVIGRKAQKGIPLCPDQIQDRLAILVDDIEANGPIRSNWANYSKLGVNKYHCHLSHKWVACWEWEKETVIVEVYYVGSRGSAPY